MRRRRAVAIGARSHLHGAVVGPARRRPRSRHRQRLFPTRKLCDTILPRYGIATTYYDPTVGSGIAALLQANTRAVFVESPGSLTFEIQDIPAIAAWRTPMMPWS
jgi:cystathionine beta-lyase/cystathionine gamma-synthase